MIKNKKKNDNLNRKLKQEELEEIEIEKEVIDEFKKNEENKLKFRDIFNDKDLSDEEYKKYMSEQEINELKKMKEEEKKFTIKSIIFICSFFVIAIISLFILSKVFENEENKIIIPAMKNYYKEKYNKPVKIDKIETVMKHLENKEVETNIKIGYIGNNHIISLDNKPVGDDFDNKMIKEYQEYFQERFRDINILSETTKLSYKDFYIDYNPFVDYINSLPNITDFNELLASKKLTVNDILVYQKDLDIYSVHNFIKDFSDDSVIYLIKHENGVPVNLSIIRKNEIISNEIISSQEVEMGINVYTLDRNSNKVGTIEIKKTNKSNIQTIGEKYQVINPYIINIDLNYSYMDNEENKNNYYLIKLNSTLIDCNNIVLFNPTSYNEGFREFNINEYPEFAVITLSNSTYLISNESLGFGSKIFESSFLCKLGLCK